MSDHDNTHSAAGEAPSVPSSAAAPGPSKPASKRKKFSIADDVVLLRQVVADTPFASGRGALMDSWESLAAKVRNIDGFSKTELKGKESQAHFVTLLQAHRQWDNKLLGLSGASVDYKEHKELLDEALLLVDEKAREDAVKSERKKEKAKAEEPIAKSVREEAVERMHKRAGSVDGGSAAKKKLKFTVYDLIREDNELVCKQKAAERQEDLEERRRERELMQEVRRREREEDREE
ncbi:hypothetical protein PHMEG_00020506 [Phytophthora megakarya]|uniref:Uncharacterized protein n=1 Tax=Phytophthora megakarya TaxID=4795 RepID=A0A225VRI7_9STRA|nr:hypothetical protein PHMEG_00020506 [Phytophthora megakarya]